MSSENRVFVFGSNLAGIHGSGAAATAFNIHGFPWGLGVGPARDCYAIPTKDCSIMTLPLSIIEQYVRQFLAFAELMEGADIQFKVTRIGCGLAGLKDKQIAPMFDSAPGNCWFDEQWESWLGAGPGRRYWGTFNG